MIKILKIMILIASLRFINAINLKDFNFSSAGVIPRVKIDKLTPQHFEFVKIDENPDISFRRVGVYAGKIDTDTEKSEQSHYFIKFTNNKSIKSNLEKLKAITFNFNNTVGPRSISKQELIKEFDKFL